MLVFIFFHICTLAFFNKSKFSQNTCSRHDSFACTLLSLSPPPPKKSVTDHDRNCWVFNLDSFGSIYSVGVQNLVKTRLVPGSCSEAYGVCLYLSWLFELRTSTSVLN